MEYIQQLRQHIGHAPILLVGAAVLIMDPEKRLLLLKRSDNACWGIPGGGMEPGEIVEMAARREVREETGLDVRKLELFGVFSGPELYYKYPNGDEVHNVTIVYLSRNVIGDIQLNHEHTNWRWFSANHIPTNISSPIKPVINKFIEIVLEEKL